MPDRAVDEIVDSLLRGSVPPGGEALAPALQGGLETVLDFLPEDALVVIDEPKAGRERLVRYAEEIHENFAAAGEGGRLACPPAELFEHPEALLARVEARNPVRF